MLGGLATPRKLSSRVRLSPEVGVGLRGLRGLRGGASCGSLVFEDLRAETTATVRARINYLLDGKPYEELHEGTVSAPDLRVRAGELYEKTIEGLVGRIARSG